MLNSEIRPLCLSFWTPPIVRPQSILLGKMIPEWMQQGLDPVVMGYDVCGKWEIDIPVYQITPFKMNKYLSRIGFLRDRAEKDYYNKLVDFTEKIIKKHNLNLVFSFANPQDSNILGAMLKQRLGIKFISHFSDPWYDNPYKEYSENQRKKVLHQEKYIIQNSHRVIFTNQAALDLVMKKYPGQWREKSRVIPHCYDLKDYPRTQKGQEDKFIISHIGALNRLRNPELLFQALRKLLDRKPDLANQVKIKVVGAGKGNTSQFTLQEMNDLVKKYNLENIIEPTPPVNYQDSLKEMQLSDCLVVIDADIKGSPFLPSKVIDYAGSGTMILGITPENSPTAQFLNGLGYTSFDYSQVDDLSYYLERIISKQEEPKPNQEFLKNFDVKNTTNQLIHQFKEIL